LENQFKNQSESTTGESLEGENVGDVEGDGFAEAVQLPPDLARALEEAELNENQKEQVINAISTSEFFCGPIPPPQILEGYENIIPGAADRILAMAENEAQHRHSVDNKCIKVDARDSLLGIITVFILGISCVFGGIAVILKIPEIAGMITGLAITSGGLGSILGVFIKGTKATWKINDNQSNKK